MRKGTTIHLEAFRVLTKCFPHMTARDMLFLLEIYWKPRQSAQELCQRTGYENHEMGEFLRRFSSTKTDPSDSSLVKVVAGKVSGRQELQLTATGENISRACYMESLKAKKQHSFKFLEMHKQKGFG